MLTGGNVMSLESHPSCDDTQLHVIEYVDDDNTSKFMVVNYIRIEGDARL